MAGTAGDGVASESDGRQRSGSGGRREQRRGLRSARAREGVRSHQPVHGRDDAGEHVDGDRVVARANAQSLTVACIRCRLTRSASARASCRS